MRDLSTIKHFPVLEELTNILMKTTLNDNPKFFRVNVAYYLTKIASTMRISVRDASNKKIPVNMFAMNLANSGLGKGFSTDILEGQVINRFKNYFEQITFPIIAANGLARLVLQQCNLPKNNDVEPEVIEKSVEAEFERAGPLLFSFNSGTSPAVKQMRHKLLMSGAGAVNLEMDEIGANLVSNTEVLNTFLELYDLGKVKAKLTKHTKENLRNQDIDGITPTNMMLFGTPSDLLEIGSITEEQFIKMLKIGYARRCFFGYDKSPLNKINLTPEELYTQKTDTKSQQYIQQLSVKLEKLADEMNFGLCLEIPKKVGILLCEYQILCRELAVDLPTHHEIRKTELQHRFSKVTRLAGVFAFIDGKSEVHEDHVYYAIKLAEESGKALKEIMTREKPHEVLAKFIVEHDGDLTIVDLMDNLPLFKGSEATRRDLLTRAITFGYTNNMLIKSTFTEGIEFFSGESLEVTDIEKLKISYSLDIAAGYIPAEAPFSKLSNLIKLTGYHYTAHHFINQQRNSLNLIEGFNLVILDVDKNTSIGTARMLLKDYTVIFSTTKRHTPQNHRFRIILPLSHTVKLNAENYTKFMQNIFNWLPFNVDEAAKDCARKWLAYPGEYFSQEGQLLNALKFIPNTNKEAKQNKKIKQYSNLNNLERWFRMNTTIGNRNEQMIRYALALVDSKKPANEIRNMLLVFNKTLKYPLPESEIINTIMNTVITTINNFNAKGP